MKAEFNLESAHEIKYQQNRYILTVIGSRAGHHKWVSKMQGV
jgi:hypothetical protein